MKADSSSQSAKLGGHAESNKDAVDIITQVLLFPVQTPNYLRYPILASAKTIVSVVLTAVSAQFSKKGLMSKLSHTLCFSEPSLGSSLLSLPHSNWLHDTRVRGSRRLSR